MKLTAKHQLATHELARGKSRVDVAAQIGIAEKTLYAWLKDDDFQKQLKQDETEYFAEYRDSIKSLLPACKQALTDILAGTNAAAKIKAIEFIGRFSNLDAAPQQNSGPVIVAFNPVGVALPNEADSDPEPTETELEPIEMEIK